MIRYGLHSAPDTMASEYEVSEFLGALVRLLKPKIILETGCYEGHSTLKMAEAIKENGTGFLIACDTDIQMCNKTSDVCRGLNVYIHCMRGEDAAKLFIGIDLAFIDSSGDRVAEVQALQLSPGAVVVLHDSKRPQYKPIWTAHPWKFVWEVPTEQGLALFFYP